MACHRFDGKVGYKGQKYRVVATKEDGTDMRLGWQNDEVIDEAWRSLAEAWRLQNLRLESSTEEG